MSQQTTECNLRLNRLCSQGPIICTTYSISDTVTVISKYVTTTHKKHGDELEDAHAHVQTQ